MMPARTSKWIGLLMALGLMVGSGGMAQTTTPTSAESELERRFRAADRNGDGKLSRAEATDAGWFTDEVIQHFDGIDRDHNGTITLYELGQAVADQVAGWMSADTNHDGQISEEEAKKAASLRETFTRADQNHDGVVSRDEMEMFSQRTYYRDAELPSVAPNIIEKRF